MARGRKPQIKIGDPVMLVKEPNKKGVVVHVNNNLDNINKIIDKPYSVHFYPNGRGNFSKEELKKVKPNAPIDE